MTRILLVGLGGFAGAVSRYLVSRAAQRLFPGLTFPLGTLLVNCLGCFLIGLMLGLVEQRQMFSPELRSLLMIGFLGGLTTFSSFGMETMVLFRNGDYLTAGLNVVLHFSIALAFVWVGMAVSVWVTK